MKLIVSTVSDEILKAYQAQVKPVAHAAQGAVKDAGGLLKTQVRANIAAAGFSLRWQNAWRVNVYPAKGESINAAAYGFHKIPYSAIFETGGTIRGKRGLLWLPLPTDPKIRGRPARPKELAARGVKLFTLKGAARPTIGAAIKLTGSAPAKGKAVSLAKLRRGTTGKRGRDAVVPLFFGVDQVTIKRRFNVSGVATTISARLGEFYFANLKPDLR